MNPYITFVVAARYYSKKTDYFLDRLQLFIDILVYQCEKFRLCSELIIIEWNPPKNKKRLYNVLSLPQNSWCIIKLISVPYKFHQQLPNSHIISFYENFAKNIGIVRAKGEYILITNIDIIFSHELVKFFSENKLSPLCFYRIDRYDYKILTIKNINKEKYFNSAKKYISKVFMEGETRDLTLIQKWKGLLTGKWYGTQQKYKIVNKHNDYLIEINNIHTFASGDFILTHQNNWKKIRGFPEFTNSVRHMDSYVCYQLHALGLKQKIFLPPLMILHLEHSHNYLTSLPTEFTEKMKMDLLKLKLKKMSPIINSKYWGFSKIKFPELIVKC